MAILSNQLKRLHPMVLSNECNSLNTIGIGSIGPNVAFKSNGVIDLFDPIDLIQRPNEEIDPLDQIEQLFHWLIGKYDPMEPKLLPILVC